MIFRSIVFSAAVAGFIVGALITVVQQFGTVPLILKGETYEKAAEKPATSGADKTSSAVTVGHADHDHASHDHGEAWEPRDGWERNSYTAAANILTAIGFALLLTGIFALRDHAVTWHEGLLWGLGGFAVFTLAPGLGLPPELPGIPVAPLLPRQIWWIATAAATAGGLGLVVFRRAPWAAILGIALIVVPHMVGAPQIDDVHTDVPANLSHQFVVATTVTSLLFWTLLGTLSSLAYRYFSAPAPAAILAGQRSD